MTMRLNLQHFSIPSTDALDSWVERQIFALGRLRQIEEVNIRLAHYADSSPAYQVNVHLVTPGPDVFAESRDHTLQAAFMKAMAGLREQITLRTQKRLQNLKGKLRARAGGRSK